MSSENKKCQNCKQDFTIKPEDFLFYEKMKVPPPTFCPECRLVRRLAWRNERFLYSRVCEKCGKPVISVYSKDKDIKVYCSPCWWKDDWDGLEHGTDFDPKKPFLIQVRELLLKVPIMNLFGLYTSLVNSDYTNMVSFLKNCYLLTHSDNNENCAYGSFTDNSKDSLDTLIVNKCEFCYESVNIQNCYRVFWSSDCDNCHDIYFSKNLIGCSDCFGCVNLRNKQYYIFNNPYTKEDYAKEISKYIPLSYQKLKEIKKQANDFSLKFPRKFIHEKHNSNISGDYIYNSKNTKDTFIASDMEDSKFCAFITPGGSKDNYDFTHYGVNAELTYDSLQVGNQTSRILFSWFSITNSMDTEYSMFVIGCKNVFGCVGLRNKQYCILNKQYSKEDYFALREKIIKQMDEMPYKDKNGSEYRYGEFFPTELSPFCYNETTAQDYFPLTKDEAEARGYRWKDREERNYNITIKSEDLPDNIKNVNDEITKEIIECGNKNPNFKIQISNQIQNPNNQDPENTNCATAFKIIREELEFYRKMNLPLPRLCPNCRHSERIKQRNPLKLWKRKCKCVGESILTTSDVVRYENTAKHFHGTEHCLNEFETTYSPERKEIVYCEECYKSEIY